MFTGPSPWYATFETKNIIYTFRLGNKAMIYNLPVLDDPRGAWN
jgi:hypothetical protein